MKLLVINPNISADVTALIESEALRSASAGTELLVRTAGHGVEYIETRFESLIAAGAVAEIIAEHTRPGADPVDAVVVAAFGDPGMPARPTHRFHYQRRRGTYWRSACTSPPWSSRGSHPPEAP